MPCPSPCLSAFPLSSQTRPLPPQSRPLPPVPGLIRARIQQFLKTAATFLPLPTPHKQSQEGQLDQSTWASGRILSGFTLDRESSWVQTTSDAHFLTSKNLELSYHILNLAFPQRKDQEVSSGTLGLDGIEVFIKNQPMFIEHLLSLLWRLCRNIPAGLPGSMVTPCPPQSIFHRAA